MVCVCPDVARAAPLITHPRYGRVCKLRVSVLCVFTFGAFIPVELNPQRRAAPIEDPVTNEEAAVWGMLLMGEDHRV